MTDCAHNNKSKSIDCATELLAARKEVMRLRTELEILKGFVRECAEITFQGDEFDGYEMQQSLIARGILAEELRTAPCSDNCTCADYLTSGTQHDCITYAPFMKQENSTT